MPATQTAARDSVFCDLVRRARQRLVVLAPAPTTAMAEAVVFLEGASVTSVVEGCGRRRHSRSRRGLSGGLLGRERDRTALLLADGERAGTSAPARPEAHGRLVGPPLEARSAFARLAPTARGRRCAARSSARLVPRASEKAVYIDVDGGVRVAGTLRHPGVITYYLSGPVLHLSAAAESDGEDDAHLPGGRPQIGDLRAAHGWAAHGRGGLRYDDRLHRGRRARAARIQGRDADGVRSARHRCAEAARVADGYGARKRARDIELVRRGRAA